MDLRNFIQVLGFDFCEDLKFQTFTPRLVGKATHHWLLSPDYSVIKQTNYSKELIEGYSNSKCLGTINSDQGIVSFNWPGFVSHFDVNPIPSLVR
jgi:hypothetical protein